jgi:hypothetical protein
VVAQGALSLGEGLVLSKAVVLVVSLVKNEGIFFRKCDLGRSFGLEIAQAFLLRKELPDVPF